MEKGASGKIISTLHVIVLESLKMLRLNCLLGFLSHFILLNIIVTSMLISLFFHGEKWTNLFIMWLLIYILCLELISLCLLSNLMLVVKVLNNLLHTVNAISSKPTE